MIFYLPRENSDSSQQSSDAYQQHDADNHDHHDDIMANAHPNLQPATRVSHEKEEIKPHNVGHDQHQEDVSQERVFESGHNCVEYTAHKDKWNDHFPQDERTHYKRRKDGKKTVDCGRVKGVDACDVPGPEKGQNSKEDAKEYLSYVIVCGVR